MEENSTHLQADSKQKVFAYDSNVAYNLDDNSRTLALDMKADVRRVA